MREGSNSASVVMLKGHDYNKVQTSSTVFPTKEMVCVSSAVQAV